MYTQIRKYKLTSGTAEQACKQAADEFLPIIRQVRGFVDYMIVDNRDGSVMSVSVFQDKAGVEESRLKALEWNRRVSPRMVEGPVEVIEGEVLVDASGFLGQKRMAA